MPLQTLMMVELRRMTEESGKFSVLINIGFWESDLEVEKTAGSFKAALAQLKLLYN